MSDRTDRPPSAAVAHRARAAAAALSQEGLDAGGQSARHRRCVITGAPHTSNWDFVFFLGTTDHFGIRPCFMGKLSLFRWPATRFMKDMGGVPIDRSQKGDHVAQMIAEFARRDELALVVAPEGTRSGGAGWHSGFYHIALGAGVPIVPAWVDSTRMRGGLGPEIMPTGDYRADLAQIAAFYRSVMPDHPRPPERIGASSVS